MAFPEFYCYMVVSKLCTLRTLYYPFDPRFVEYTLLLFLDQATNLIFALVNLNYQKWVFWRVVNFCDMGGDYVTVSGVTKLYQSGRHRTASAPHYCIYKQSGHHTAVFTNIHLKSQSTTAAHHHIQEVLSSRLGPRATGLSWFCQTLQIWRDTLAN
jgi:hypothetical protein